MMYKKHLVYAAFLCGALFSNQLDAKSSKTCGTTKCCVTPSSPTFDCIKQFTDYIIVGLGTAGAVLARKLSDPLADGTRCNVTVLEAGQNRSQDPVVMSNNPFGPNQAELTSNSKFAYTFAQKWGSQADFDNDGIFLSEGRMWGGGSAHHFMTTVRGTEEYWNNSADAVGDQRWNYTNMLDIMKGVETYKIGAGGVFIPTQRGDSGLLSVVQGSFTTVSTNDFNVNVMTMIPGTTLPFINDYNAAGNPPNAGPIGVTVGQSFTTGGLFFPPSSQRAHSQNSFCPTPLDVDVNPIAIIGTDGRGLDGRKLQVVSNALVCRVIFDGNCAVGVEYILNGDKSQVFTLCARKEVILCAGAVNDPAILQRSGVGPPALLAELEIDVVVANDNVGANLENHYGSSCVMTAGSTAQDNTATGSTFWSDGAPYFNNMQPSDLVRRIQCIYNSGPNMQSPSAAAFAANQGVILDPGSNPTNSFLFVNLVPKARGTVVISSSDCTLAPTLDYGFWDDFTGNNFNGSDFDVTLAVFKIINDAATLANETMVYPTPAMFTAGDAALMKAATLGTSVFSHTSSSCKMAPTAATGVCDSELRVFGTKNLRCADLSVVPIIPDGNTAFPCYYIGCRAAQLIRGEI